MFIDAHGQKNHGGLGCSSNFCLNFQGGPLFGGLLYFYYNVFWTFSWRGGVCCFIPNVHLWVVLLGLEILISSEWSWVRLLFSSVQKITCWLSIKSWQLKCRVSTVSFPYVSIFDMVLRRDFQSQQFKKKHVNYTESLDVLKSQILTVLLS